MSHDPKVLDAIAKEFDNMFSDEGLKNEAFILRQVQKNPGGWIPLKTILNRNRFNCLRSLTKDIKTIAAAIERTPNGLVQVSADRQKVRRNPNVPLPELAKKF
jgi:lupus La protein